MIGKTKIVRASVCAVLLWSGTTLAEDRVTAEAEGPPVDVIEIFGFADRRPYGAQLTGLFARERARVLVVVPRHDMCVLARKRARSRIGLHDTEGCRHQNHECCEMEVHKRLRALTRYV